MCAKEIDKLLLGNPLHVVDVGASGGLQSRWATLTSQLVAVLVEPDPQAAAELRQTSGARHIVIDHALSDRKGDVVLNICRKRTVSSLYPPDGSFWTKFPDAARAEVMQVARVQADTLDNQLNEHDVKDVDFIKLDVHGHEIAIL